MWDRCVSHDTPGACFTVLVVRRFDPGAVYSKQVIWDQRSAPDGSKSVPVPAGTYRFTTDHQYIAGSPSVAFKLGVTKTPPPECASSALASSITTNRRSYAPGQEVVMRTSATNVSGSPCSAVVSAIVATRRRSKSPAQRGRRSGIGAGSTTNLAPALKFSWRIRSAVASRS